MRVVPCSGRAAQDETGQWYVVRQNGQRHRGERRQCVGCGETFLCSSGTKRKNRRFCSRACGNRTSPTQRGYGKPAGTVRANSDGYLREKTDDGRWIGQHRLILERLLGRALTSDETVHHIDGDRTNNAPSNLQLRSRAHGMGQRLHCLDCGSTNVSAAQL